MAIGVHRFAPEESKDPELVKRILAKERRDTEEENYQELDKRAREAIAGGPALKPGERREISAQWAARLSEEESDALAEKLWKRQERED